MSSSATSARRLVVIAACGAVVAAAVAGAGPAVASSTSTTSTTSSVSSVSHRTAATTPPPEPGSYRALPPVRVLDTGSGLGAPKKPVASLASLTLSVLGHAGVPSSGVGAVVLNVTVASPTGSGYLTVYPAGGTRPVTSTLNFTTGRTVANLAVAKLGSAGQVTIYNGSSGTARIVADVEGYVVAGTPTAAGTYTALTPARIADTGSGLNAPKAPVGGGQTLEVVVQGRGGVPASGAGAVLLNITAATPAAVGHLTVYAAGTTRPATSNVNFTAGRSVANLVLVPMGTFGITDIYNGSSGATRVVADVEGYVSGGTPAAPGAIARVAPHRLLDTGSGAGAVQSLHTVSLPVLGQGGVPSTGVDAVVLNVTVASPTASGYLTAYPTGSARPVTSMLNFSAGQAVANLVVARLGAGGQVTIYNGSAGSDRLIADVQGYVLATPPPSLTWTPTTIDPPHSSLASVACPSVHECVAVDGYGNAQIGTDGSWTRPSRVAPSALTSVSCPTTTFCAAVGADGTVWNGSTWSTPTALTTGPQLSSVSCPTATFCLAVGGDSGAEATWTSGGGWTSSGDPSLGTPLSVSCASSTVCREVNTGGQVATYNAGNWSTPVDVFGQASTDATIDCPTTTFCLAVAHNDVATFNGTTWSTPTAEGGPAGLVGASCPTASRCFSLGADDGTAWTLANGSTWSQSATSSGLGEHGSLSCPTTTYCGVIGASLPNSPADAVAVFDGTAWSGEDVIDVLDSGQLASVSCPTTMFCAAVDQGGFATTYDGTSWSVPTVIYPRTGFNDVRLASVSCPSATFCLAVSADGLAITYNGSAWSAPVHVTTLGFRQVSCATASFCVAIDSSTQARMYIGGVWSGDFGVGSGSGLTAVSCGAVGQCAVVDSGGEVVTYDTDAWNHPVRIDTVTPNLTSISCPTATDCTVTDDRANAIQLVGSTWTAPSLVDPVNSSITAISCVAPATCQAVDIAGDVLPVVNGIGGSRQQVALTYQPAGISCATAAFCVEVDDQGQAAVGRG